MTGDLWKRLRPRPHLTCNWFSPVVGFPVLPNRAAFAFLTPNCCRMVPPGLKLKHGRAFVHQSEEFFTESSQSGRTKKKNRCASGIGNLVNSPMHVVRPTLLDMSSWWSLQQIRLHLICIFSVFLIWWSIELHNLSKRKLVCEDREGIKVFKERCNSSHHFKAIREAHYWPLHVHRCEFDDGELRK